MVSWGLVFIFLGRYPANWLSGNPQVAELTRQCLLITGFIQAGFAASITFAGALRGAGDTVSVMLLNLASIIGIRMIGVLIVGLYFRAGLPAIWMVLSGELFCRGVLVYARFLHGGWRHIKV